MVEQADVGDHVAFYDRNRKQDVHGEVREVFHRGPAEAYALIGIEDESRDEVVPLRRLVMVRRSYRARAHVRRV